MPSIASSSGESLLGDRSMTAETSNKVDTVKETAEQSEAQDDAALAEAKKLHDSIKETMKEICSGKNPLHPEVQELRDKFWEKYTPASLRTLLLEEQNAGVRKFLILSTAIMFSVPVGIMLITSCILPSEMDDDTRMLIGAIAGIVMVNVILAVVCVIAYKEEKSNYEAKNQVSELIRDKRREDAAKAKSKHD